MSAPISIYQRRKHNISNHKPISRSYPISKHQASEDSYYKFQKRYEWNKLRKCSYALAIMNPNVFLSMGAVKIDDGVYIMPKKYDGSPSGETCAIVGISKRNIYQILNKDSNLYYTLRNNRLLENIPGIKDLSPYRLVAFKYMMKFLYFVYDGEIILFNIEPKGTSINKERLYPCANICLPGGGMEPKDQCCWERCVRREFAEEVGFELPTSSEDFKIISRQKFTFTDRQCMYFWGRLYNTRKT